MRHQLGALALGHLSPSERIAVEAHLEGCELCRREAGELAGVADLLPLADPGRLDARPQPPPHLLERVFEKIRDEHELDRRRAKRRIGARVALGIAAAIVALVLIAAPFGPQGEVVTLASVLPGVTGEITLYERETSQWVELATDGLPVGKTYALWIRDRRTGERVRCGTFAITPGPLHIALYSSVARNDAAAVGVSELNGEIVMQAPLAAAVD